MTLSHIFLFLAALGSGIASGAIHELAGKRWAVVWTMVMAFVLLGLFIF